MTKRNEIIKAPVDGAEPNFTVYVEYSNCGNPRCKKCYSNGVKLNNAPHGPYYLFSRSNHGHNQRIRISGFPINEDYLRAINTAQIPFNTSTQVIREQIKLVIADYIRLGS